MIASTLFLAFAALTGLASAQSNYSQPANGQNLTIDINQVPLSTRQGWCTAERNTCPEVCNGTTAAGGNTCDPTTLLYGCTCSNGVQPNMTDYQQSLPGQLCRTWFANCIENHPDDLAGQQICKSVVCGNKTIGATSATSSSSASSSAATSAAGSSGAAAASTSASGTGTATASAATNSATHSGAAVALGVAKDYGTGILGAAALALFGLAL